MTLEWRLVHVLSAIASLLVLSSAFAASDQIRNAPQTKPATLSFGGMDYLHRWSKDGQNEFTPESDSDLARWHDMITINVHETVGNGEQLADLANRVLGNYQSHGKIVRTVSKPRTPQRPARLVLVDGAGVIAIYSHRVYGKEAAETIGQWLETKGPAVEKTLMAWDKMPRLAALKNLPQNK